MKRPRLDARGVAHHFLLAIVVVGIAIGGTYYLIRSFADTCGTSDPTSSVSDPVTGVSDPVTAPANCVGASDPVTSPVAATKLSCAISGVAAQPTYGSKVTPTVTIYNYTAKKAAAFKAVESYTGVGVATKPTTTVLAIPALAAGKTYTAKFNGVFTIPYVTNTTGSYNTASFTITGSGSANTTFRCTKSVSLPTKIAASCTITGLPKSAPAYGSSITAKVAITNKSAGSADATAPLNLGNVAITAQTKSNQWSIWGSGSPAITSLPVGATATTSTTFKVPYAGTKGDTMSVTVTSPKLSTLKCSGSFTLPVPTTPKITSSASLTVPYNGSFTVSGTAGANEPLQLKGESTFTKNFVADAKGHFAVTVTGNTANHTLTVYARNVSDASGVNTSFKSSTSVNVKRQVVITTPASSSTTVKKGSNLTFKGVFAPNVSLTATLSVSGSTPATKKVTTDKNGAFSFSATFNKTTKVYVTSPNDANSPTYTVNVK